MPRIKPRVHEDGSVAVGAEERAFVTVGPHLTAADDADSVSRRPDVCSDPSSRAVGMLADCLGIWLVLEREDALQRIALLEREGHSTTS